MVKLTKIYTKTGDKGTTALGNNSRVPKWHPLIEAYATVDEANSQIGVVLNFGRVDEYGYSLLKQIQNELFDVGADLCTPIVNITNLEGIRITPEMVRNLEEEIDEYNATLKPLNSFVLPGGGQTSSLLHVARTIVRRAERNAWKAREETYINPDALKYLNRLSDLLFVMARYFSLDEQLWLNGEDR